MYDRYDSNKGRYVTYDYQPKGDRFSRGLSKMPRARKHIHNTSTGTTYYRRSRTDEAQQLTVNMFKKMLPEKHQADFYMDTFYLRDYNHDSLAFAEVSLKSPGLPISFDVTEQHKGERVWFFCPHCQRRVGKLYRLRASHHLFRLWGCQKCLGLSYPSQAGHRTQVRDMAITQGQLLVSWREEMEAVHRQHHRIMKLSASAERLFGKFGMQ